MTKPKHPIHRIAQERDVAYRLTKDVEAFRRRTNAILLHAALTLAGIPSRVCSQGDGAVWVVFCSPEHHDAAYEISTATIYV